MQYEEKQHIQIDGEWHERIYVYDPDLSGHPLSESVTKVTDSEKLIELNSVPKPSSIQLDLIPLLAVELLPYKSEIDTWLLNSPIMAALFGQKRNFDKNGIELLQTVIVDEPIKKQIKDIINNKLEEIKETLG